MIGDRIRDLRISRRMTQKDLANILRVTPQTVCNWEKGVKAPHLDALIMIAKHFSVSTDFILELTTEKNKTIDFGSMPEDLTDIMTLLINALRNKYSD